MVKIYIKKILAGTMRWNKVPSLWIDAVCEELDVQGYQLNEDGTVAQKPINEPEVELTEGE